MHEQENHPLGTCRKMRWLSALEDPPDRRGRSCPARKQAHQAEAASGALQRDTVDDGMGRVSILQDYLSGRK